MVIGREAERVWYGDWQRVCGVKMINRDDITSSTAMQNRTGCRTQQAASRSKAVPEPQKFISPSSTPQNHTVRLIDLILVTPAGPSSFNHTEAFLAAPLRCVCDDAPC